MKNRIVIKSSKAGMTVILDPECSFEELIAELATKFKESARFWGNAQMALLLQGRPLTAAQEMQIVNTITENSGIEVLCLLDQDLERVERCEKALNQKLMELSERTGQFYRGDLHRGESIESEASIVITPRRPCGGKRKHHCAGGTARFRPCWSCRKPGSGGGSHGDGASADPHC